MFFKKPKPIIQKVKVDPVNEDLLKKEIFSAEEAHEMGVQARIQKRNNNRKSVFQNIKYSLQSGLTSSVMTLNLFDDGNDIYFEGLGYKVEKIWHDQHGHLHVGEPGENDVIEQTQWGGQSVVPYRYRPNVQIKVSWEK